MNLQLPVIDSIADTELEARLQYKINHLTKPLGSLGQIEALALQLGLICQSESPHLVEPQLLVFAGDHGLAQQGVSAYPGDVTWQMVENFLSGGACVSVLCKNQNIALNVVDCGVKHDFHEPNQPPRKGLLHYKIAYGTQDSSRYSAMTYEQCQNAIQNGMTLAAQLPGNVLLLGEMGIGNTSAASLIMSRMLQLDIAQCTGAGTGLDSAGITHKTNVLRQVLERHLHVTQPLDVLATFGGFEMACMLGAVLQAAHERRVIVVDGFITTAVILLAHALQPYVLQRCVFAHRSDERAHNLMLQHLQVKPLLDLGMRLGEGSGAAMAWPLLLSASHIMQEMASFAAAGVDEKL